MRQVNGKQYAFSEVERISKKENSLVLKLITELAPASNCSILL